MPLIAVDIGNSYAKFACYPPGTLDPTQSSGLPTPSKLFRCPINSLDLAGLAQWLPREQATWRVAAVQSRAAAVLATWVQNVRERDDYRLLAHTDLPLIVTVHRPDMVGVDRLSAAVGANRLRTPGRAAIVVDAGTVINIELVDTDGSFQGGSFFPGLRLCQEAFRNGTAYLPLIEAVASERLPIGNNSREAIQRGLFWGGIGAVREIVGCIQQTVEHSGKGIAEVFVTGGDPRPFSEFISEAKLVPNLVLGGIAVAASQCD